MHQANRRRLKFREIRGHLSSKEIQAWFDTVTRVRKGGPYGKKILLPKARPAMEFM